MGGKVNKRVDCLVRLLLKYEVDLFFNRKPKTLCGSTIVKKPEKNRDINQELKLVLKILRFDR